MKKEEYKLLKMKYMSQGCTSKEAHARIGNFINELKRIKEQMKLKQKSEAEIKSKIQKEFEKEFQKLCCFDEK